MTARDFVKIKRSQSGDAVGVEIGAVSFRSLMHALSALPEAKVGKTRQNPMTDDATAEFYYRGQRFEVHTPLSDYWIDRPTECPAAVFEDVVRHLEKYPVRWWNRLF